MPNVGLCGSTSYYMEVLHQDYGGLGSLRLGLFTGHSAFTADQSDDAVNEVQLIVADYDIEDEEQVRDKDDDDLIIRNHLLYVNVYVKMFKTMHHRSDRCITDEMFCLYVPVGSFETVPVINGYTNKM